jgi:two-component system sensor histidine kinase KdpD
MRVPGALRRTATRWIVSLAALAALTIAMLTIGARLDKAHVALGFLLLVLAASALAGRTLGLAMASFAFLLFNYFFVPPHGTLVVADPLDWLVLFTFLATSVVAAQLLHRANTTAALATARADEVDRLATLGAETLSAPGASEALGAVVSVIRSSLGVDTTEVYMRAVSGHATCAAVATRDGNMPVPTSQDAASLIAWIGESGEGAAELVDGTVRLSPAATGELGRSGAHWMGRTGVRALLLPLSVRAHPVGVLRIASTNGVVLSAEQSRLLAALTHYAALGLERVRLERSAEQAEAERRVESMRTSLLMSVSHDLRTPLTTIKAIAHGIANGGDPAQASTIESEADRLDALVADLLDLSRIHAGALRPELAINTAEELIGAALRRAAGALAGHVVVAGSPSSDLLAGRFDFTHALRVVVNLLENSAKYAPSGSTVELLAARAGDQLEFRVLDRGVGVPAGEAERIFEPFYRPPGATPDVRGSGLGLSIARGLAHAQHGGVRYEPRAGGGSIFTFHVPAVDLGSALGGDREEGEIPS